MSTDEGPPDDLVPDDNPFEARIEQLRVAWVAAVRDYHSRRTGVPSQYRSKPRWDGGYDAATQRYYKSSVWAKIVTEADDLGIDPLKLLNSLFDNLSGDHVPQPNAIVDPTNVRRSQRKSANSPEEIARAVNTQFQVFRSALWAATRTTLDPHPKAPVRTVLNDLSLPLSPLFRYAVAVLEGQADQAGRWKIYALQQFGRDADLYRKYWGHMLPAEMTRDTTQPKVDRG